METPTKGGSLDSETARLRFALPRVPSRPATPGSPKKLLRPSGSLRSLRSKLSWSSLSGRGKKAGSPERGTSGLDAHVTSPSASPPSRVHHHHRSFRPLSIVHGAMNPFDFDVAGAMEAVQFQAQQFSSPSRSPSREKEDTTTKAAIEGAMSSDMNDNNALQAQVPRLSNEDRDEDEKTIKASVPSQEEVVTGDFKSLMDLPPPDISQHPAFASDPKSSTSNAPLMITTSTAAEIRKWAQEKKRREASERGDGEKTAPTNNQIQATASRNAFAAYVNNNPGRMEPNHPFNTSRPALAHPAEGAIMESPFNHSQHFGNNRPTGLRRREDGRQSTEADVYNMRNNLSRLQLGPDNYSRAEFDHYESASAAGGSPTGVRRVSHPKTPVDSSIRSATSTPVSEGFDHKKTGLRKVTDMFKTKTDRQPDFAADGGPLRSFQRPDLERHLRTTLNCHTYDYSPDQPLPRHPTTGRGWKSRNLHCTNCMDKCCAVCGRACCAFKAASLALKNHKDNPEGLLRAQDTLANIAVIYSYGQEAPTFLQCTHGAPGDTVGCGKMVCPDCCGMCPNAICADIQCRKCKKQPWAECQWHDSEMNRMAI